jgi:PAS domain S-box-containing protein
MHRLCLAFACLGLVFFFPTTGTGESPADSASAKVEAIEALMETDLTGAMELAESALMQPWASDPAVQTKLRIRISAASRSLGNLTRAEDEAERAIELAQGLEDLELRAAALNEKVGAILAQGRTDEALVLAEETLRLRRAVGDSAEMAKSLNNIGLINSRTGRYADALGYYMESLRLKESAGDVDSMASTLNNIAIVRFEMGDLEASEHNLLRARAIYEKSGDLSGLADVLDNLGRARREQGRLDEALEFHLASLEVEEQLGRPEGMAISLNHAGLIYNRLGRHEEALQSIEQALEINRTLALPFGLAFSLLHYGVAQFRLGHLEAASVALEEGIDFARQTGDPVLLRDLHRNLAEVQSEQGRFAEAYLSLTETRRLDQQIVSYENADRVANLEATLKIEQKDREIETLQLERELHQLTIDRNEQEIALLAQSNRVSRLTRNSLIIAFVALTAFLMILHSRYRLKKQAEQTLRDKNAEIIRQSGMVEAQGRKISEANRELHVINMKLRELSRAVEQSPTGVLITDRNGTITYVNPRFTEATGYSLEDVRGANPRIFKSGHHGKDFYRQLWSTVRTGRIWRGRFVNRRKDGSLYSEEATISPVINEVGEIFNFVAVMEFHLDPIESEPAGEPSSTERLTIERELSLIENEVLPVLEGCQDVPPDGGGSNGAESLAGASAALRQGIARLRSVQVGLTAAVKGDTAPPRRAHLVVDRRINGKVLTNLMGRLGCSVTEAKDLEDPFAGMKTDAVDLVVMDIDPEDRSVTELIHRIRSQGEGSDAGRPRVVCIANADTEESGDWIEAGADSVLTRPVDLEMLRRELD